MGKTAQRYALLTSTASQPAILFWRPCPFFCPPLPDYFKSWVQLMAARSRIAGPVVIDIPEAAPFPRGTHDLSGVIIHVSETNRVTVEGEPGARCGT